MIYHIIVIVFDGMMLKMELKELEEIASKLVMDKLRDWYDIVSFGEPVIESSDSDNKGDIQFYILKGYIEVEFKGGWRTSAREQSRSGKILFTIKLNSKNGKLIGIRHEESRN
jgi:hypothetical protein